MPNDGNVHFATFLGSLVVSTLEVGGQIGFTFTAGGRTATLSLFAAARPVGANAPHDGGGGAPFIAVDPGTQVIIVQLTALTGGASVLYGAIVGV